MSAPSWPSHGSPTFTKGKEMSQCQPPGSVPHQLLLLPLLDAPLGCGLPVLLAGARIFLLIQLPLDTLPLLHQRWHLCLALLALCHKK